MIKARRPISNLETATCLLVTAASIWLMATFLVHAGPLWRDEINTRWMAMRPSLSELWRWMDKDSYPLLWFGVLRAWIAAGLGETDPGLRVLGFLVGMFQLAAIYGASRFQSRRLPLLFLALFALSPLMFRFATSIRAYGLGVVTMLLMVGWLWAYIHHPSARRLFFSAIFSFLAVHTLYYNSITLCAVCVAGVAVCMTAGRFRQAASIVLVGGTCGLSVLPYIFGPMTNAKEWNHMYHSAGVTTSVLIGRFSSALDFANPGQAWVLLALAVTVFVGCVAGCVRWRSPRRKQRALFIVLAMPLLAVLHFAFLLSLHYITQPWYYVSLLAFLALLVDRGADLLIRKNKRARIARMLLVVGLALWTIQGNLASARERQTNMDIAAAYLAQNASKDDFIVVTPWYMGTSFDRYYHGPAAWSVVPPISDYSILRTDQAIASLSRAENIMPVLQKIRQAIKSGHRVWYVGEPNLPPDASKVPAEIPSVVPHGPESLAQIRIWEANVGYELIVDRSLVQMVPLPEPTPISRYEVTRLYVFQAY